MQEHINKIVAVTMVRDEEDIIESFIRHAMSIADAMILCNHNSSDSTMEIVNGLRDEGLDIFTKEFRSPAYDQEIVMTGLMREAVNDYGADIVLLLDADEFLVSQKGGPEQIRSYLQDFPLDKAQWLWLDWFSSELADPNKDLDRFILSRPILRRPTPEAPTGKAIATRKAVEDGLIVCVGNHAIVTEEAYRNRIGGDIRIDTKFFRVPSEELYNLHIPLRSYQQFLAKYLTTWIAWASRASVHSSEGALYHKAFQQYLGGTKPQYQHVRGAVPIELSEYKDHAPLRFGSRQPDVLSRVLAQSETLADTLASMKARVSLPSLALVLCCYGKDFCREWLSEALNVKTYAEIHAILITDKESKIASEEEAAKHPELHPMLMDVSDFHNVKDAIPSSARFVQWLTPQDYMKEGRLDEMLKCAVLNPHAELCVSGYERPSDKLAPPYVSYDSPMPSEYRGALDFIPVLLELGSPCPFSIGSVLFSAKAFQEVQHIFTSRNLDMISTWVKVLWELRERRRSIVLFSEHLSRKKRAPWSKKEHAAYRKDWKDSIAMAEERNMVTSKVIQKAKKKYRETN